MPTITAISTIIASGLKPIFHSPNKGAGLITAAAQGAQNPKPDISL